MQKGLQTSVQLTRGASPQHVDRTWRRGPRPWVTAPAPSTSCGETGCPAGPRPPRSPRSWRCSLRVAAARPAPVSDQDRESAPLSEPAPASERASEATPSRARNRGRLALARLAGLTAAAGGLARFTTVAPDDDMAPTLLAGDLVLLAPRHPPTGLRGGARGPTKSFALDPPAGGDRGRADPGGGQGLLLGQPGRPAGGEGPRRHLRDPPGVYTPCAALHADAPGRVGSRHDPRRLRLPGSGRPGRGHGQPLVGPHPARGPASKGAAQRQPAAASLAGLGGVGAARERRLRAPARSQCASGRWGSPQPHIS